MNAAFIDGRWISASETFETRNPSDLDETVAVYGAASARDAEAAIGAARAALPAWRGFNTQARFDILRKAGDALLAQAEEIGALLAREEGKVLREAIGETVRAAQVFHYFAGEVVRHPGQVLPSLRDGHDVRVDHEPVGVCALITPWNFPIAIPAWKVAAALAYGNTCVLKPSEFAPGCAVRLVEILSNAGLPAGVLNLVHGDGRQLGPALIGGADAVSFTGATPTGQAILVQAAATMTKVQLELGGKNPLVVLDDADLDLAVEVALHGTFGQTGQRCTGSSRLIVTRKIHDAFVQALARKTAALRVGHALDAATEIGPVATDVQMAKNLDFIAGAKADGAELVAGGEVLHLAHRGRYLSPALFVGSRNDQPLNRHEVFGPVAGVIAVEDLDEAIAVARDCELALSSGICTQNLSAVERFRRASPAGMVMVNTPTAGVEYHVPFGGRAPSGYGGREQGSAAADFFTEMKTTYVRHGVA
ncbi:aldehyde dehydrogenase family protein [Caulobacter sp. Root342]|uniref:aldehyde dehydrogenase family protein n=1 Tax=Caulobacter sp. Root342 TaxID=1736519 RepID=UPI0007010C63|nr:aldehyde dehydrogenase family protein [Caulobacter sp. Root342]KQV54693.1 aldehyde dehydrogenase [Caulobacter sp. Root342]